MRKALQREAAIDRDLQERNLDSSPAGIARHLILQHSSDLLLVRTQQGDHSDLLVADETGVWTRGDEKLQRMMLDRAERLRCEVVLRGGDDKLHQQMIRATKPLSDRKHSVYRWGGGFRGAQSRRRKSRLSE